MGYLIAFVAGACVGIAPWHWLARRVNTLLERIEEENRRNSEAEKG